MSDMDFEQAYLREKSLREAAEQQLQDRTKELSDSLAALQNAHSSMKENQNLMVHNEKMASLGVLSAGVAHEINNPVGFIYSNFCSLAEGFRDIHQFILQIDQTIEKSSDIAQVKETWSMGLKQYDIQYLLDDFESLSNETIDGLERVKQIVADLKSFTREDSGSMDPVNINECLRAAINILSNQTKYHAKVEVDYGSVPSVKGYFGKLNQVFTNLIANANQAVDENGVIHIRTWAEGQKVLISVSDNGHGIAEEHMKQLFTPFFTTKPVGEGTGLGLSISHGLVEEHRGEISVKSEVGQGTTFTIALPAG